jgi:hypothetical protein
MMTSCNGNIEQGSALKFDLFWNLAMTLEIEKGTWITGLKTRIAWQLQSWQWFGWLSADIFCKCNFTEQDNIC